MNPFNYIFLFLSLLISSCGKASLQTEPPQPQPPSPPVVAIPDLLSPFLSGRPVQADPLKTENLAKARQRLNQILVENKDCEVPGPGCDLVELQFSPNPPFPNSTKIMVIDYGLEAMNLNVHRNRVIQFFRQKTTDTAASDFEVFRPTHEIPKWFHETLETLSANPRLAALSSLQDLSRIYGRRLNKWHSTIFSSKDYGYHGLPSVNLIAELIPDAQFILVEYAQIRAAEICPAIRDNQLVGLKNLWQEKGEKLGLIARTHGVKFINLSLGIDPVRFNPNWHRECGTTPNRAAMQNFMEAWTHFLRTLQVSSGAVIVQSAVDTNDLITAENFADYRPDCENIPGRIRVGYANAGAQSRVPPGGILNQTGNAWIPQVHLNSARCTDFYLNDQRNEPFFFTGEGISNSLTGFGQGPPSGSSTSFIAPLGVAFLAWVQSEGFPLQTFERNFESTRAPWVFDPLFHRQVPLQDEDYINWPQVLVEENK